MRCGAEHWSKLLNQMLRGKFLMEKSWHDACFCCCCCRVQSYRLLSHVCVCVCVGISKTYSSPKNLFYLFSCNSYEGAQKGYAGRRRLPEFEANQRSRWQISRRVGRRCWSWAGQSRADCQKRRWRRARRRRLKLTSRLMLLTYAECQPASQPASLLAC